MLLPEASTLHDAFQPVQPSFLDSAINVAWSVMSNPQLIIVTGANRGIGLAICKLLLQRTEPAPLRLFAASRSGVDLGLSTNAADRQVLYPKLDIVDRHSIARFASEVKQHGKVDVLINNAGVNLEAQYNPENARKTIDVNYRGMLEMCRAILPLMSPRGRIVNLSSVASSLKQYSEAIQARFRNPENNVEDLDKLAEEYLSSVSSSTETQAGFARPGMSYNVSKALVNSLTSILARDHPNLLINSCCPGWIATDMGRLVGSGSVQPPKTPEEGARIPVRLALEDLGGVTGRYWANGSVRSRESGRVQEW